MRKTWSPFFGGRPGAGAAAAACAAGLVLLACAGMDTTYHLGLPFATRMAA